MCFYDLGQMWREAYPENLTATSCWKTVVASTANQANGRHSLDFKINFYMNYSWLTVFWGGGGGGDIKSLFIFRVCFYHYYSFYSRSISIIDR